MEILVRNLKIIWRTEAMIAEHRKRLLMRQMGYVALAGMVALFGVFMLDCAAFFAMRPTIGDASSALVIGIANLIIALILVYSARGVEEGPELRSVREVRDMAIEDLTKEAAHVQSEVRALRDEVRNVEKAVRSFVKNPLDTITPAVLMPVISAVLKALSKK